MNSILTVITAGLLQAYILAMLVIGWPTRIFLLLSIGLFFIHCTRQYEKHYRAERFDDRPRQERMDIALQSLVQHFSAKSQKKVVKKKI